MSEAKFSKGPWPISCVEHETMIADWYVNVGGVNINMFPYKRIYSEDRTLSAFVLDEEKKANMHLISAAPDLYEALDTLVRVIESAGIDNLSNGVQLGQTVWYVKCYDAVDYAKKSLEKSRGEA